MIRKLTSLLRKPSKFHLVAESHTSRKSEFADRMEGSILLGAAGDAMGYVVKFQQVDEIFHQFAGPISFSDPDRWRDHQCGHIVSDDTQMTMFGMEAIARTIEKRSDNFVSFMIDETRISYLEWYETQGRMTVARSGTELLSYREMFANRAPGVTCLDALRLGGHGHVQSPVNDSKGCGGVLRRSRSCLTWKRIRSGCLPPPPPR